MIRLKDLILEQHMSHAEEKAAGKMCGNCEYFVKETKECMLLTPSNVAYKGMCDLWERGEPKERAEPKGTTPQAEAHYTDNWKDHKWNRDSD